MKGRVIFHIVCKIVKPFIFGMWQMGRRGKLISLIEVLVHQCRSTIESYRESTIAFETDPYATRKSQLRSNRNAQELR